MWLAGCDGRKGAGDGNVAAKAAGGKRAIEDVGIGFAVLVVGNEPGASDFEAVGGVEVLPVAEGFPLRGKESGVGGVCLDFVHGVEIEHGTGDVAFVVFTGFEVAVDVLAVLLDAGGGNAGADVVEVIPLGRLLVGDFGERVVATGGVDGAAGGEKMVHVTLGVAGLSAF